MTTINIPFDLFLKILAEIGGQPIVSDLGPLYKELRQEMHKFIKVHDQPEIKKEALKKAIGAKLLDIPEKDTPAPKQTKKPGPLAMAREFIKNNPDAKCPEVKAFLVSKGVLPHTAGAAFSKANREKL